jgi:hypothetical protein
MLTNVPASNGLTVHLLSQIDGKVEKKPVNEQVAAPAIEAQAIQVAQLFANFAKAANTTLDICIYDFRLALKAVSQKIVDAINDAANRGVRVRVAYDANQKATRRSSSSSVAPAATPRQPGPRRSSKPHFSQQLKPSPSPRSQARRRKWPTSRLWRAARSCTTST